MRRGRRTNHPMGCPQAGSLPDSGTRYRLAFSFSIERDLGFISHRDTMRLFRRALARAGLGVRFTEGFNPRPRISLPLPRPVGVTSGAELLVVHFTEPIDPDQAMETLNRVLPEDVEMTGVRSLAQGEQPEPIEATYRLRLEDQPGVDMGEKLREIFDSQTVEIKRTDHKTRSVRVVDVRPYLVAAHAQGDAVVFTIAVTPTGTCKPSEFAGLLGFDPNSINHCIHRTEIKWK